MNDSPDQNDRVSGDRFSGDQDPFYVGYLPAPEPHRRSVHLAITLIAIWIVLCSITIILSTRSPGSGVWDTSNEMSWSGLLLEQPYPVLITPDDTLLVVSMGKRGADEHLRGSFGKHVTLRGYQLQRRGRKMIELIPDSIETLAGTTIPAPTLTMVDDQPREVIGEIIDGKCYLGAMKPGDGFAHRSCAVLCLRGGLPPMFAKEDRGEGLLPLLIIDGQAQLPDHQYHLVATRVKMQARQARFGQLPVLIVDSGTIEQINTFLGIPNSIVVEAGTD